MVRIAQIGVDAGVLLCCFFEETPAGEDDRKDVILNEVKDLSFQSRDSSLRSE